MNTQLGFFEDKDIIDPDRIARDYLIQTKGIGSPTINSVSGGRSSSWMAINYPADYTVFALVRTDDPDHIPKDEGLVRAIKEKCPEFTGSLELPDTLRCVLELEQKIGREITWVWNEYTFEELVYKRKSGFLPNLHTRYCTELLKVLPILDWFTTNFAGNISEMNIGFRADEPKRVYRMIGGKQSNGGWDFSRLGECGKHPRSRKKIEWRFKQAPMYLDGVRKHTIYSDPWVQSQPFPEISDCTHCFFYSGKMHRRQHQLHPKTANFWINLENSTGSTFAPKSLQSVLQESDSPLLESLEEEIPGCGCLLD